jgi:hypothetical protein
VRSQLKRGRSKDWKEKETRYDDVEDEHTMSFHLYSEVCSYIIKIVIIIHVQGGTEHRVSVHCLSASFCFIYPLFLR